ncbi:hypothetical protein [uncultured Desulfovibrio sp.]|uniref:hypothetical protein n=1 Tax=uncultured Desulfovibrio sp. TaxID=167968 RepID=UPI00260B43D5|nr:hypothetical protein [uncultured Desulfovibrio sp.]
MATLDLSTAPISGHVGALHVNKGNIVTTDDTPVVTIDTLSPIYVNFSVPGVHLPAILERMRQGDVHQGHARRRNCGKRPADLGGTRLWTRVLAPSACAARSRILTVASDPASLWRWDCSGRGARTGRRQGRPRRVPQGQGALRALGRVSVVDGQVRLVPGLAVQVLE